MSNEVFDVNAFYSQLENKQASQPSTSGENAPRLKKIFLNAPPNHGTITILPFQDPVSKMFYTYFDKDTEKIKELKVWNDDQDDDKWLKILPKSLLGQLSPEDEALYNEVTSLWDKVYGDEILDYKTIKAKAYTLIYGYVISHFNTKNESVEDSTGKMALIVVPTPLFAYKQRTNIDQVKASAGGDISWLGSILNNNTSGRNAYLKISFLPAANNQIGYDLTVSHEFNNPGSPIGMVVPADLVISDADLKLISKGHVADFMGWQSGESGLFNRNLYIDMRYRLQEAMGVVVNSAPVSAPPMPNQVDAAMAVPPVQATGHVDPLANGQVTPPPTAVPPVAPPPVIPAAAPPVAPVAEVPVAPVPPVQ